MTWYIKHSNDHPNAGITNIQNALNREFSRPKFETQSIIEFKEIVILPGETPWNLDQWPKCMIHEANMMLTDAHTTPEDDAVTTEAFNPGQSIGNGDEIAQDPDTRSWVGSSKNPCTTIESMPGDAKFEAG